MYAQNATLRAHALGSFATLLHAASKEPAMLVYLDVAQSRRGQPNENFAREVMELFTLGEGQYTEQDVKEAARAFTGWSVDRESGQYLFRPGLHDPGVKTVLGRTGRFDGDAVLDVVLARPQASEYITAKLWREFVGSEPDAAEVTRIAALFRGHDYDVKVALRALFLADAFWAADQRGHAREESGRARRRHAAAARAHARAGDAVRRRRRRHGPEPVLPAEREGLARRRRVDQQQHAARAQAVPRPRRAHGRRTRAR